MADEGRKILTVSSNEFPKYMKLVCSECTTTSESIGVCSRVYCDALWFFWGCVEIGRLIGEKRR